MSEESRPTSEPEPDEAAGSPAPRTVHDALFKGIFGDPGHAAEALRAALPAEVARHIDWDTLTPARANVVARNLRQQYGDVIFDAKLKGGQDAVLWVLFEHQSTVDRWMALRLAELTIALWKRWRTEHRHARWLPVVLPVVLYHGPSPWTAPTSLRQLVELSDQARQDLGKYLLSCEFVLDDLVTLSDDALLLREMAPYAKLALVVLKYGRSPDLPEHLARHEAEIRALLTGDDGEEQWLFLMRYTWLVNPDVSPQQFSHHLRSILGPEINAMTMTVGERLLQQEHERGKKAGQQAGQRELLRLQLAQRFGSLSDAFEQRLARADAADLQRWGRRVLDAPSLEDVFAPA